MYDPRSSGSLMMQWSLLSHPFLLHAVPLEGKFFLSVFIPFVVNGFFQLKGWKGLKKGREKNRIRKILSLDEVVL
jgi:hypothetical protein